MSGAALDAALAANLEALRRRVAEACAREGRLEGAVRLVCVTKAFSDAALGALVRLGVRDLGENRIPQLLARQSALAAEQPALAAALRWHMVGHLQRNKAKGFVQSRALLHSLASLELLEVLERRLEQTGAASPLEVLVEVAVAGEPRKYGLAPAEVPALLDRAAASGRVRVSGLMAMAPYGASAEQARAVFAGLRAIRDRQRERHEALVELSMGMSADFEAAIAEGATLIRVGTALLEGLPREARGA